MPPSFHYRSTTLWVLITTVLYIAVGSVSLLPAQTQTTPRPASSPEASQTPKPRTEAVTTGTIKGRVVSDDGRPLTNATIIAQAVTGAPAARPTRVDAEGRFVLDDLPAAAYVIIANAPGYIDPTLSLGGPGDWPRHLIGAQLKITMTKGGVITGTVTNFKGDPVVGVPVRASLQNAPMSFTALFGGGNAVESDDRGVYRIYGLLPGQYIVSAGGSGQFALFAANGFDLDVPTYYPSSTRDTAVPIAVRSGDETTGIDIKYRGAEGHSISGVVSGAPDSNAAAPGAIAILLSHAGTASIVSITIAGAVNQRPAFGFNGVADGEYDLLASLQTTPNDNSLVATKRVTVRAGDVTGVELKLSTLASIAGTITLDPIKPEDKCDKRDSQVIETIINAPRDDLKKTSNAAIPLLFGPIGNTLNAKGEFTIHNLEAGRYRFEIKLPTEAWYVRSINAPAAAAQRGGPQPGGAAANQTDASQGLLSLKAGERISGVSIVIGQNAASLHGRIAGTTEAMAIPAGARVHLVPAEREQANNVLRYSEAPVSTDGSFIFMNIAPGRYFILFAVDPPAERELPPRPAAWDSTSRAKVHHDAEAAGTVVELKPCQRLVDYSLAVKTIP